MVPSNLLQKSIKMNCARGTLITVIGFFKHSKVSVATIGYPISGVGNTAQINF